MTGGRTASSLHRRGHTGERQPIPTAIPVAVIDRASAKVIYTMRNCGGDLCIPGLIEIHPTQPVLYLAFPKKVLAYNTISRQTQGRPFVSGSWVDGMALTPDGKELLVGAPLRSAILRFDALSWSRGRGSTPLSACGLLPWTPSEIWCLLEASPRTRWM